MNIAIRRAEASDIAWILSQLKEFAQFIKTRHSLYGSEEYSIKGLQLLIDENVFLIAEKNSIPIGFVSGYLTPHLFNPDITILCELFFWVVPSHRGCRAGSMLMDAYIAEGYKKAKWITFSINRFTRVNERSLIRRGFAHHESTYLLEV